MISFTQFLPHGGRFQDQTVLSMGSVNSIMSFSCSLARASRANVPDTSWLPFEVVPRSTPASSLFHAATVALWPLSPHPPCAAPPMFSHPTAAVLIPPSQFSPLWLAPTPAPSPRNATCPFSPTPAPATPASMPPRQRTIPAGSF